MGWRCQLRRSDAPGCGAGRSPCRPPAPSSGRLSTSRSCGAFSAFLVALFVEVYGFPLTIYVLSGWLQSRYPGVEWFSHDAGHLLEMIFGWKTNPHFGPFHVLSFALIGAGFALISVAWKTLYSAQRQGRIASEGAYAYARHPQCVGFVLILLGFLVQWPTLLTLAMFPLLVVMYARLARSEERDALERFGEAYAAYMRKVPAFFPKWSALLRHKSAPPPRRA